MRPSLQFRLNQQLTMTPQLQQAIRLLQLSSLELELEIRTTLGSNLVLEAVEEEASMSADTELNVLQEEIEESEHFASASSRTDWDPAPAQKKNTDFFLQKSSETTLRQHLFWQLELGSFSEREKIIAINLIDAISEEGYLIGSLSEIQESIEIKSDLNEIEKVLQAIQQFDPIGVGSRTLSECLNIQLNALPPSHPWLAETQILVSKHLGSLGKRDYTRLKLELNLSEEALMGAIKTLTSLNPRPGTEISSKKSEYVIPDILVRKKNGHLVVELNKEFIPELRVNPNYVAWLQGANTKGNVEMLKEQLKEAKWFLKSLEARHETLLKVAKSILEQQKDFLAFGEEYMKPLSLQDIAKRVGLHESTISRITTQKYILTPRGVFELKYFFSTEISSPQGSPSSSTAVRALIKKLISEEPSQTPLSDHKITQSLLEYGIEIARRTVTKYREAMHIPSSTERKNLNLY